MKPGRQNSPKIAQIKMFSRFSGTISYDAAVSTSPIKVSVENFTLLNDFLIKLSSTLMPKLENYCTTMSQIAISIFFSTLNLTFLYNHSIDFPFNFQTYCILQVGVSSIRSSRIFFPFVQQLLLRMFQKLLIPLIALKISNLVQYEIIIFPIVKRLLTQSWSTLIHVL